MSPKSKVRLLQVGASIRRNKRARKLGEESIVIRPESRTWHSVPRSWQTSWRSVCRASAFRVLCQKRATILI
jgi:hypothetical protein